IANWTGWTMMRLTKDEWIGLHIWFSLLFLVAGVFHTYFNWTSLMGYFRNKATRAFAFRTEWILAMIACAAIYFGTLSEIRPFSSLLAWSESIKHSWDTPARQAPIPHAELLTLSELAAQVEGGDLQAMLDNLKSRGIEIDSSDTVLGALAEANNMTPAQLYDIALGRAGPGQGRGGGQGGGRGQGGHGGGSGDGSFGEAGQGSRGAGTGGSGGFGRMTLQEYCGQANLDVEAVVQKLKNAGFQATPDMTIRAIADNAGVHPSEVRNVLEPAAH
ncbi:MAG: DUF4405 domain-containing protein, partial [Sedimentisphaerales bacterium]|nr:DUF4405 domain-containing protein [Sedimentisphaerales bacterium]